MLSPLAAFYKAVEEQPNQVYLRQPINGHYQEFSWSQVEVLARNMAYQLSKLGIKQGTRLHFGQRIVHSGLWPTWRS